jgi:hypothetical protein
MVRKLRGGLGRLSPGIVFGAVVLSVVAAGVAVASIPSGDGTISGCRNSKTGILRVIDADAGQSCLAGESPLAWKDGIHGKVADSDKLDGLDSTAFVRKIASGRAFLPAQTVAAGSCTDEPSFSAPGALETDVVAVSLVGEVPKFAHFDVVGQVHLDEVTLQPLVGILACNDSDSTQTWPGAIVRYLVLR